MLPVLKIASLIVTVRSSTVCNGGCSSHGVCEHGTCHCQVDWTGNDCSFYLASVSNEEDKLLSQDITLNQQNCIGGCSGHGSCLGDVCFCSSGWGGTSCSSETTCPGGCSNGGTCRMGACLCRVGFFGANCADQACPNDCFGHGTCEQGRCRCGAGWTGDLCLLELEAQVLCDPQCQQGAACIKGQCFCPQGFYGTDCSIPVGVVAKQEIKKESKESPVQAMVSLAHSVAPLFWPVSASTDAKGKAAAGLRGHSTLGAKSQTDETAMPASSASSNHMESMLKSILASKDDQNRPAAFHANPTSVPASPASLQLLALQGNRAEPAISEASHSESPLLEKLEQVAQLAGDSATKLWREAQTTKTLRAKERIHRAVALAHMHADELPGHEFSHRNNKPQNNDSHLGSIALSQNASADLAKATANVSVDEDDAAVTRLKGNAADATAMAKKRAKRMADNYASTTCDGGCSGHGVCGTNKECVCVEPWLGESCDTPRCENDCNSQGVCVRGKCICSEAFVGTSCQMKRCPNDCSGNGYCQQGECQCLEHATGPSCSFIQKDEKLPMVSFEMSSSKEKTDAGSGRPRVVTLQGFGPTAVIQRLKPHAPRPPAPSPPSPAPTSAPLNQIPVFFKSSIQPAICAPGYGGSNCRMPLMCADNTCSGHGQCVSGKCVCTRGFGGDFCSHNLGRCSRNCGIRGYCNGKTGMCECHQGWTGPICEVSLLQCPDSCGGHGACLHNKCVCTEGWSGSQCTQFSQPVNAVVSVDRATLAMLQRDQLNRSHSSSCQSNADCKTRGICVTGKCLCIRGWGGTDCTEERSPTQESSRDEVIVSPAAPASLKELSHMQITSHDQAALLPVLPAASKSQNVSNSWIPSFRQQLRHKEVLVQRLDEPLPHRHKHKELKTISLDDLPWESED